MKWSAFLVLAIIVGCQQEIVHPKPKVKENFGTLTPTAPSVDPVPLPANEDVLKAQQCREKLNKLKLLDTTIQKLNKQLDGKVDEIRAFGIKSPDDLPKLTNSIRAKLLSEEIYLIHSHIEKLRRQYSDLYSECCRLISDMRVIEINGSVKPFLGKRVVEDSVVDQINAEKFLKEQLKNRPKLEERKPTPVVPQTPAPVVPAPIPIVPIVPPKPKLKMEEQVQTISFTQPINSIPSQIDIWDNWWRTHCKEHASHSCDCTVYYCGHNHIFWSYCYPALKQMFPNESMVYQRGVYKINLPQREFYINYADKTWGFITNRTHGYFCPYHR